MPSVVQLAVLAPVRDSTSCGLCRERLVLTCQIRHQCWTVSLTGPLMPYVLGAWATAAAIGAWALFPERPTEPPVVP